MNLTAILFGLRLLSGLLLLAFLGLLFWLIYQDLRSTAKLLDNEGKRQGYLRVVASENNAITLDTLYPLFAVTTIGRSPSCSIYLNDNFVSNEHAVLFHKAKQWWLEDLDSSNGTLLNDIEVHEQVVLGLGDIITIGNTRLKVESIT